MSFQIPRTDWTIDNGITNDDLIRIESNTAELSRLLVAGGTPTSIALDCGPLTDMRFIHFVASNQNNGAATKINNIPLYKPGTALPPTLLAGKAYSVWYNSVNNCFFIKASAEGNALASQVLKDVTFSNIVDTNLKGTLDLSLLIPANIKKDVNINGVIGTASPQSLGGYALKTGTVTSTHDTYPSITIPDVPFVPKFAFILSMSSGACTVLYYESGTNYIVTPGYNLAETYEYREDYEDQYASSTTNNAVFSNGTFTYAKAYPSDSLAVKGRGKTYRYFLFG